MKMYTNMTNIIVRLSCGPECDDNAVLLNAHYDTTLGSPGAVDDALPIGVMVELIRILSQRPALRKNSLIFCKYNTLHCVLGVHFSGVTELGYVDTNNESTVPPFYSPITPH